MCAESMGHGERQSQRSMEREIPPFGLIRPMPDFRPPGRMAIIDKSGNIAGFFLFAFLKNKFGRF